MIPLLRIALAVLLPAVSAAALYGHLQNAEIAADNIGARTVLDVTVFDSDGSPVTHLTADDFLIFENGAPRPILDAATPRTPWNVLLLFNRHLAWLNTRNNIDALQEFLVSLRTEDQVALAAFQDSVDPLVRWVGAGPGNPALAGVGPRPLSVRDANDLYGAIEWAAASMAGVNGRKIAIVFTDGRDSRLAPLWLTGSPDAVVDPLFGLPNEAELLKFQQAVEAAAASGVRFFFVAAGVRQDPEFQGRSLSRLFPGYWEAVSAYIAQTRSRMERMAQVSGGAVFYRDTVEQAVAQYGGLRRDLRLETVYTLEFETLAAPAEASIEVRTRDPQFRVVRAGSPDASE